MQGSTDDRNGPNFWRGCRDPRSEDLVRIFNRGCKDARTVESVRFLRRKCKDPRTAESDQILKGEWRDPRTTGLARIWKTGCREPRTAGLVCILKREQGSTDRRFGPNLKNGRPKGSKFLKGMQGSTDRRFSPNFQQGMQGSTDGRVGPISSKEIQGSTDGRFGPNFERGSTDRLIGRNFIWNTQLRVLPPIFDPSLSSQFLKTDDARTNRFFSLKQLTPKVHGDTTSDDTAPSSGSSEQIKLKTTNAIYFCYSYPILMTIPSFDWKFYWLSQMGIQSWNFCQKTVFCLKMVFFQKNGTSLTSSDSPENWYLD